MTTLYDPAEARGASRSARAVSAALRVRFSSRVRPSTDAMILASAPDRDAFALAALPLPLAVIMLIAAAAVWRTSCRAITPDYPPLFIGNAIEGTNSKPLVYLHRSLAYFRDKAFFLIV